MLKIDAAGAKKSRLLVASMDQAPKTQEPTIPIITLPDKCPHLSKLDV